MLYREKFKKRIERLLPKNPEETQYDRGGDTG